MKHEKDAMARRAFLCRASLGAGALSASRQAIAAPRPRPERPPLPLVPLGDKRITRLIAGYNPVGGYSHGNRTLSKLMREWFTVDRTVDFLKHCEALGINTFQFDLSRKVEQVLDRLWESESRLNFLCLHAERPSDAPLKAVVKYRAFAVAHHGGVTDARFRLGEASRVRDYVKKLHDAGCLAGVSTHSPENLARMLDEAWEADFYMACFHNIARTSEEMQRDLGLETVGEPFVESDPERMTAVIRQADKPCLAFKILAAGRRCISHQGAGKAFQYAFDNIKKSDAVIVGMFPYFEDEVAENVGHTIRYGN